MKLFFSFLLLFLSLQANPNSKTPWTGEWHVSWKQGSFVLNLEQSGTEVKGTFEPENGTFKGKVSNETLKGVTKTEQGLSNTLTFIMGESQNTFFGSESHGEWLSGVRVSKDIAYNNLAIDLSSPAKATYSFLSLGNAVRDGHYRALEKALDVLHFSSEQARLPHAVRLALAKKLFLVLDQCTIKKRDFLRSTSPSSDTLWIHQEGSDIRIPLSFTKMSNEAVWKMNVPTSDTLTKQLSALLKKRGKYEVNPRDNLKLEHARASIRTFMEEYDRWEEGGKALVISTLNLSHIDPAIHEWQAALLAYYLKSVLDRVSTIVYQELPNDPKSKKPYVHYNHSKGNVVLAPYTVDGKSIWQFTPQTLSHISALYFEMSAVKPLHETKKIKENNLYFWFQKQAKSLSPFLLKDVYHTEYWQILMLMCIVFFALFVAYIVRFVMVKSFKTFYLTKRWTFEMMNLRYIKPMQLVVFAVILLYGAHSLGLSNLLFSVVKSFSHLLIVLGITWISYNLVTLIFDILQIYARRTSTNVDEIILSLASSVVRILVIVIAIFLIAEILKVPYKTVVAGLGIGGLAFAIAAKDSISNFFGSAIIIADRPFKTGDRVKVGTKVGVISKVGIRSTKIRTLDDTLLTVPNNLITNEIIDNYSERDVMRVETEFFLDLNTSKEILDALDTDILTYLEENVDVESKKDILTGVNDFTNKGIVFSVIFYVKANTESRYSELRHRIMTELADIIKQKGIVLVLLPTNVYTD